MVAVLWPSYDCTVFTLALLAIISEVARALAHCSHHHRAGCARVLVVPMTVLEFTFDVARSTRTRPRPRRPYEWCAVVRFSTAAYRIALFHRQLSDHRTENASALDFPISRMTAGDGRCNRLGVDRAGELRAVVAHQPHLIHGARRRRRHVIHHQHNGVLLA
jgi:hypothetical protein